MGEVLRLHNRHFLRSPRLCGEIPVSCSLCEIHTELSRLDAEFVAVFKTPVPSGDRGFYIYPPATRPMDTLSLLLVHISFSVGQVTQTELHGFWDGRDSVILLIVMPAIKGKPSILPSEIKRADSGAK